VKKVGVWKPTVEGREREKERYLNERNDIASP
jgi:hypothetical protein